MVTKLGYHGNSLSNMINQAVFLASGSANLMYMYINYNTF